MLKWLYSLPFVVSLSFSFLPPRFSQKIVQSLIFVSLVVLAAVEHNFTVVW